MVKEMVLDVNDIKYNISPYSCSPNNKFPFYINTTNICNAKCDFCSNGNNKDLGKLNLNLLENILDQINDKISRFSISGGEPLIDSDELDKLLKLLSKYNIRITINTNGYLLPNNLDILNKYKNIESIQLSRHHYEDKKNNDIFKINNILFEDIKK